MSTLMTEPAAAALIVVDETSRATLSEIARVNGKPLSTVQRAVDDLLDAWTTFGIVCPTIGVSSDACPTSVGCPTTPLKVGIPTR